MQTKIKGNLKALLPLVIFIVLYLGGSWYLGDFYQLSVLSVFMLAMFVAFIQFPQTKFNIKLREFTKGAGDETLLIMVLIFLLAGAFSEVSKQMGAVDSVVNVALHYIPSSFLIAGFFIIASFISVSIGTSVGTIAVLTPLALGMQDSIGSAFFVLLAAIVGGAMFGDNLSFISDTTIAATRTQGIKMRDKFRVNIRIVAIPALVTLVLYLLIPIEVQNTSIVELSWLDYVKMIPYVIVFILAVNGIHVIITLSLALASSFIIGFTTGSFNVLEALSAMQVGIESMLKLSILCLIIGGVVGLIRFHGGIAYLLSAITKRINSSKHAEFGIAFLTGIVNACVANNTIAILIVGPVAKEIAENNNVRLDRSASIMDTISCFIQGILPYGAQILTVLSLVGFSISPFSIIQHLYYPFFIGIATFVYIFFFSKKSNDKKKATNY